MTDALDNAKEHRWWIRVYDLAVHRFAWWFLTSVIVALMVSGIITWAFTPGKGYHIIDTTGESSSEIDG